MGRIYFLKGTNIFLNLYWRTQNKLSYNKEWLLDALYFSTSVSIKIINKNISALKTKQAIRIRIACFLSLIIKLVFYKINIASP